MVSQLAKEIAYYLIKLEDPALTEQIKVLGGDSESFIEYELSFIDKETAESSPFGYSGSKIPVNEIRQILFSRKWRC